MFLTRVPKIALYIRHDNFCNIAFDNIYIILQIVLFFIYLFQLFFITILLYLKSEVLMREFSLREIYNANAT